MPYTDRIAKVMSYFDLPQDQRPTFFTLYLEGVDSAGHNYGPDSIKMQEAIAKVDAAIASVVNQVKKYFFMRFLTISWRIASFLIK
jgi:predicted AlkP superfamily pyrophosphatase or phosphodiesterase